MSGFEASSAAADPAPTVAAAGGRSHKSRQKTGDDASGTAFRALLQEGDKRVALKAGPPRTEREPAQDDAEPTPAEAMPGLEPRLDPAPQAASPQADPARLLFAALQDPALAAPRSAREAKRDGAVGTQTPAKTTAAAMVQAARQGQLQLPASSAVPASLPQPASLALPGSLALPEEPAHLGAPTLAAAFNRQGEPGRSASSLAKDQRAEPPVTVKILRQETYLPPVLRLSPLLQVSEPIRQAAGELASEPPAAAPDRAAAPGRAIVSPAKILHIRLSPVELGQIVVKMRLAQGGMEIRLEASRAETAEFFSRDRDALRELIRAGDTTLDAVAIECVHVEAGGLDLSPRGQEPAAGERGPQGDGNGFGQPRQGEDRPPPRQNGQQPFVPSREEPHETLPSARADAHRYL